MPSVPQEKVIALLKEYKERHKITYDELAEKLDMSATGIKYWIYGKQGLSYYSFCKIQDLLEEDGIFLYG